MVHPVPISAFTHTHWEAIARANNLGPHGTGMVEYSLVISRSMPIRQAGLNACPWWLVCKAVPVVVNHTGEAGLWHSIQVVVVVASELF